MGRYYLYYAPHDAPGGICLAYGNSLSGSFTEYAGNPIVARTWSPHYNVSHVSSPHVIWNESNRRFYLYFHGENNTTRLAWSDDGVNWSYTRKIFLAWSSDQRAWTVRQTAVVSPAPDGELQIANAHLALKDGIPHIIYNGSSGPVYVTRVGVEFDQEVHLGVLHRGLSGFPDSRRTAAPSFAQEGGTIHMFYESGLRLQARIARATAPARSGLSFPT